MLVSETEFQGISVKVAHFGLFNVDRPLVGGHPNVGTDVCVRNGLNAPLAKVDQLHCTEAT